MVCAQVIGNHAAITVAGQSGNFQLNVMLPLIAHDLLDSIRLLANVSCACSPTMRSPASRSRQDRVREALDRNPILVTALNPIIGYEKAAAIAKQAYKEGRAVLDVAVEATGLPEKELRRLAGSRGADARAASSKAEVAVAAVDAATPRWSRTAGLTAWPVPLDGSAAAFAAKFSCLGGLRARTDLVAAVARCRPGPSSRTARILAATPSASAATPSSPAACRTASAPTPSSCRPRLRRAFRSRRCCR